MNVSIAKHIKHAQVKKILVQCIYPNIYRNIRHFPLKGNIRHFPFFDKKFRHVWGRRKRWITHVSNSHGSHTKTGTPWGPSKTNRVTVCAQPISLRSQCDYQEYDEERRPFHNAWKYLASLKSFSEIDENEQCFQSFELLSSGADMYRKFAFKNGYINRLQFYLVSPLHSTGRTLTYDCSKVIL